MMKPLLIYDGDCKFCRRWIERWRSITHEQINYAPYQEVSQQYPQISRDQFQQSVQLIETDGKIYSGAEAVFRTLSQSPNRSWMLGLYQKLPGFKVITEWFYRSVAGNRNIFSDLTQFFWGNSLQPSTFHISRDIFLRSLAVIYLIAFASLWSQIVGLIGDDGILPLHQTLTNVQNYYGEERFFLFPTLSWFNASETFLHVLCGGGILLSLLLFLNVAPTLVLFLLWIFYLSLQKNGSQFLSFQWDILLLEVGFLAIFLAPLHLFPKRSLLPAGPPKPVLFLFWWLLFRLVYLSGIVKLKSGDETWKNLTALTYHYETQPLPTWVSWYAHHLPVWFHQFSTVTMFAIELVIPFLLFFPRVIRLWAGGLIVFLQVLIFGTGNYTFFNLLTIGLCILLVDDAVYLGHEKDRLLQFQDERSQTGAKTWPKWLIQPICIFIFLVSLVPTMNRLGNRDAVPRWLSQGYEWVRPFEIVNAYGLFAVMTTLRPEIIVEGSHDGYEWKAYEFKYKPGDLGRKPRFVAPHQPRLDWQMWFAALSTVNNNPWFVNFCKRLLDGSPPVLALMAHNPFPDAPPKFLRARVFLYEFTDPATRKQTGKWWTRKFQADYLPPISLNRNT